MVNVNALNIIVCIVMFIITGYLTLIYFSDPEFKNIPHKFNIAFSTIIALNFFVRIIPLTRDNDQEETSVFCKIQAFLLTTLDKLMLTSMTSFSFIWCYIIFNKEKLRNIHKEIKLYLITNITGLILSILCCIIFISQGISDRSEFCYVSTTSEVKQWIDSIVIIILFIINLVCLIIIIVKTKEMQQIGTVDKKKEAYVYDLKRFVIGLFINIFIFIYVFLLIIKKIPFEGYGKDIIYILLSLFADLYIIADEKLKNYLKRRFGCENNNNSVENLIPPENNANNDENNI